jgi:nitroreductase
MQKPAPVDHPIQELMRQRWSPRAFTPQPLAPDVLLSIFEAARWAPSSANEQPWRVIVANRDDAVEFQRLLACLVPGNQRWAANAGALALTVTHLAFERNNKPNPHAWHDAGIALAHMLLEATARGIAAHPMAGFDAAVARSTYAIPDGFDPVAAVAFGHPASPDALPDDLRERELAPRTRRPLAQSVYTGRWEHTAPFIPR